MGSGGSPRAERPRAKAAHAPRARRVATRLRSGRSASEFEGPREQGCGPLCQHLRKFSVDAHNLGGRRPLNLLPLPATGYWVTVTHEGEGSQRQREGWLGPPVGCRGEAPGSKRKGPR